jgi:TolA-binding protein
MLVAADEPAKANELLDRLVKQFPSSALIPRALFLSAEARSEQHDFAAVVERLAPLAAKPLPEDLLPGVLYRLGRAHIELAAWSDAKASFERLDREFPEGPLRREAEFWIAEADRQQGDPKAAAVRLARLVAEPGEREPWIATAWLRLAQCQGELKRWKDLLSTTEQLRERFPRYELMNVAEYHSGRALQNLGRFDEAREAYRRAIGGHGDETAAQSQFMIGETYFHQKRYQEALREFLKVEILYAFPRWQADALLEAGKCHENLQENSRAVETYNRILEKYPNTPAAERASERLRLIMK